MIYHEFNEEILCEVIIKPEWRAVTMMTIWFAMMMPLLLSCQSVAEAPKSIAVLESILISITQIVICYNVILSFAEPLISMTHSVIDHNIMYPYTAERRDVLGCTSPTIKRFPEAREMSRGTSRRPREISRSEGIYNPIHPDSRQCTAILSS